MDCKIFSDSGYQLFMVTGDDNGKQRAIPFESFPIPVLFVSEATIIPEGSAWPANGRREWRNNTAQRAISRLLALQLDHNLAK
jgi:hypothetical protein